MDLTEKNLIEYGFIKYGTNSETKWFKMCNKGINKLVITENKELFTNKHLSYYFSCGGFSTESSIDVEIVTCSDLENLYKGLTKCNLITQMN